MEIRGVEPRASRMRSERSTTELHPRRHQNWIEFVIILFTAGSWRLGPNQITFARRTGPRCSKPRVSGMELMPNFNSDIKLLTLWYLETLKKIEKFFLENTFEQQQQKNWIKI